MPYALNPKLYVNIYICVCVYMDIKGFRFFQAFGVGNQAEHGKLQ